MHDFCGRCVQYKLYSVKVRNHGPHNRTLLATDATGSWKCYYESRTVTYMKHTRFDMITSVAVYFVLATCSLVPRPSPAPVFDFAYCKRSKTGAGEGLGMRLSNMHNNPHTIISNKPKAEKGNHS